MFDKPSSDSWNSIASTAPSHGLYLYDLRYDEADLELPIEYKKSEQPIHSENLVENSLDLKKEIIKQRIINRKAALDARITKSKEKIENHELLKSIKK